MTTSIIAPASGATLTGQTLTSCAWPTDNVLTYWFTGLSGAGKSTLAQALAKHLRTLGQAVCVLDGDDLRTELCKDLGFSDADRTENMRRAAAVAKLLNSQGITVIAALISPLAAGRTAARTVIGTERFVEVHIDTPLSVCQQRDPKGLYAQARSNPALAMSGIGSRYEAPESPDLRIDTSQLSPQKAVARISNFKRSFSTAVERCSVTPASSATSTS